MSCLHHPDRPSLKCEMCRTLHMTGRKAEYVQPRPMWVDGEITWDHENFFPKTPGKRLHPSIIRYPTSGGEYVFCWCDGLKVSDIWAVALDKEFQPKGEPKKLAIKHSDSNYGRENPSLFIFKGQLHVSFVGLKGDSNNPENATTMYAGITKDFRGSRVFTVKPSRSEKYIGHKTLQFFESGGELFLVYQLSPLSILRVRGNYCELAVGMDTKFLWSESVIQGVSNPVFRNDKLYTFCNGRCVTLSTTYPFNVTKCTTTQVVEVNPSGAVVDGEDWVISYGVDNQYSRIRRFNFYEIDKSLVNVQLPPKPVDQTYSVTIPAFHRTRELRRCLESVAGSSIKPEEVIVVDNGCDLDESYFTELGLPIRVIKPGRNLGVATAWNLGRKESKTDNLIVMNDDAYVGRDSIQTLVNIPPTAGLGFLFDPESGFAGGYSCFLWRLLAVEKIGYFDEKFWPAYNEDVDYTDRFRRSDLPNEFYVCARGKLGHDKLQ